MNAEIICVGTELLLGDIVNTNAQYISRQLAGLGIDVYFQSVVGDNEVRLLEHIERVVDRCDILIMTGGLGPTKDDMTKEVVAKFFKVPLVMNDMAYANMDKRVRAYTHQNPSISNQKQAYVPEGAIILQNAHGTAPGFVMNQNKKIVIVLPGPPKEMKLMFDKQVVPYLRQLSDKILVSKTLQTFHITEANVNDLCIDLLDSKNPTVAPYAKENGVELRITAAARNVEKANKLLEPMLKELRKRLGQHIYSETGMTLEEVAIQKILHKHQRLAVIEGATRGHLVYKLTQVEGMHRVLAFNRVAVNEEQFRQFHFAYDYVSESYVKLLAEQFFWQLGCISVVTSLSSQDTSGKRTVYIAVCCDEGCFSERVELFGDETEIINRVCNCALDLIRIHIS